jgi:peptidoglycan/xylan/chitin deacetylase (PgdA/CDA1 family)
MKASCTLISRRQALTGSLATAVSLSRLLSQVAPAQGRKVAIKIDDGPAVGAGNDLALYQKIQAGLVSCFRAEQVPVIMFVNERQLNVDGQRDVSVQILHNWLDAGFDLGNHMYCHPQLAQMQLWQFEDDLIKGEVLIRPILEARGKKLVWFDSGYASSARKGQG